MKHRYQSLIAFSVVTLYVVGCSDDKAVSDPTHTGSTSGTTSVPGTDTWIGQWNGPEGTFLQIIGGKGQYEITIRNLDGPSNYQGTAVNGQIQFVRNGVEESIRSTNGAETGMKWLGEKSNCLTVRFGEGYCRD